MAFHYYVNMTFSNPQNGTNALYSCNIHLIQELIGIFWFTKCTVHNRGQSLLRILIDYRDIFFSPAVDRGFRSLLAARSSSPSTTAAPTQLATALSAPTIPYQFSIFRRLDTRFSTPILMLSLLPVLTSTTRPHPAKSSAFIFKSDRSKPC